MARCTWKDEDGRCGLGRASGFEFCEAHTQRAIVVAKKTQRALAEPRDTPDVSKILDFVADALWYHPPKIAKSRGAAAGLGAKKEGKKGGKKKGGKKKGGKKKGAKKAAK